MNDFQLYSDPLPFRLTGLLVMFKRISEAKGNKHVMIYL